MRRAYCSGGIAAVAESAWGVTSANASGDTSVTSANASGDTSADASGETSGETSVADGWEVVQEDDREMEEEIASIFG